MELKEHLRNLSKRKGKLSMTDIIHELEESAKNGECDARFGSDDVLDDDMLALENQGLEVEFYGGHYPMYVVRW